MNRNYLLPGTFFFARYQIKHLVLFVLFPLLLLMAYPVHAQKGYLSINGKITDQQTGEPVQQASVSVSKKGIGTSTNAAGLFGLLIPAANLNDTLKISFIGFKTKQLPISSLKNGETLNITLEKNTTELQAVSIVFYDPLKIIQKAIARIPENYIDHPHILRGFYRMYTFSNDNPLQLSEAVFDVYNFGYTDKRADVLRLIKARNEKNHRDFDSLELGQNPNSVFEYDIINHIYTSGLLNDAGLKIHQFEVVGVVDFQGYQAYEIDFKEKKGVTGKAFRGRMFIDTKTYAFIYFDFGLSPDALTDPESGNFVTHALMRVGNVRVDLKKDHSKISYQEVGHKWVLSNVAGDNILVVKSTAPKADLTANVKFSYQVTAVDTVAKESINSNLGRNENINEHETNGDPKFWNNYNILLSDYNTEDIFKKIDTINKLK